eukprot:SAG22_NODE_13770_length_395_cov_1.037162_2_plen_80_part_01
MQNASALAEPRILSRMSHVRPVFYTAIYMEYGPEIYSPGTAVRARTMKRPSERRHMHPWAWGGSVRQQGPALAATPRRRR